MRIKIIFICLFVLTCMAVQAQKEAYNWTFGYNAGLTWNTKQQYVYGNFDVVSGQYKSVLSMPTPFKSSINTYKGCFALSDGATGDLLLYSDGKTVYESKGSSIGSNLNGHSLSAQSGILMPFPGARNRGKYIVVTAPEKLTAYQRPSYSVIQISNGVPELLNTTEHPMNAELQNGKGVMGGSVTAIQHANRRDFWIVAPGSGKTEEATKTTAINAWKVTKDGVDALNPVVNKDGLPEVDAFGNGATSHGYIKFSPNGKNFVWVYFGVNNSSFMVGHFDTKTGEVGKNAKVVQLYYDGQKIGANGLEFSHSGKYLYIVSSAGTLYAYNFESLINNPTTAIPKIYDLGYEETSGSVTNKLFPGVPQLGPDKLIYMTVYNASASTLSPANSRRHMYVIENPEINPNSSTPLNIYRLKNFLTVNTGGHSGITSFSPSFFATDVDGPTEVCVGEENTYTFMIGGTEDTRPNKIQWFFGEDGTYTEQIINADGSLTKECKMTYTTLGTKQLTVKVFVKDVLSETIDIEVDVLDCSYPVNPHLRSAYK